MKISAMNNNDSGRARNEAEAVEMAVTGKNIDLILMDIRMPVMEEYEAAVKNKKLR